MYHNPYRLFAYNKLYRGRRLESSITEISYGNTEDYLSKWTKRADGTLFKHSALNYRICIRYQ